MAACMTTILHPVLAHLVDACTHPLEAQPPIGEVTTPETSPILDPDTKAETAMTSADDPRDLLRGAHDTATATAIAKTTAHEAEAEATVAAGVEAHGAVDRITDRRAERL
ncbi:uncharacterized protein DSM5745_02918 [Aspergillus mulundensis]|uniref:Uncharacterized protein n=1 Tax=Aspergillus mulundensis TaxID=1810919 RepID=A0A3D8SJ11_9EURO|nr:hypothetical protein DSM5745_02918 [Aspergillus mulundensis]RDW86276.1 hypothetical protein DSM5745_02918 [Aspergillus mulundensis]